MGAIYMRGKTFWISYYHNGRQIRESAKTKKEADAKRILKSREGEIADGKLPGVYFDKVSFNELAKDFLADYRINGKKSLDRAERSVEHLKKVFAGLMVIEITTPRIRSYVEDRINEGAASATTNRELAALKRMLNMGARQTPPKVDRVPYIPMLKENNVRKGFFEHGDFIKFRDALPFYLQGYVTFAYKTGWRSSEISNLEWSQVDRVNGIVRLESGETKNDEGRTIYLDHELKGIIGHQWKLRESRKTILPYVFTNEEGTDRIKEYRSAWSKACVKTGLGKKLFHDFRRTACRNMVRAGIPERVAMMVSGHKTRSIFERYNVVDGNDLKQAAQRQEDYLKTQTSTIPSTIALFPKKEGLAAEAKPL
jgi:integrase